MSTFLENALAPITEAAKKLQLSDVVLQKIKQPEHVFEKTLTITLDTGESASFSAWRVQWSSILGPYKGGIRFAPDATVEEVSALAALMTFKNSLLALPLGGGKGAVCVDSKKLSKTELEKLSKAYAAAFFEHLGPEKDVPAPDVHTNAEIIGWMSDEYNRLAGGSIPGTFTGKPIEKGGSHGREVSTSYGGFVILEQYLAKVTGVEKTVAIQGFGNVGAHLAKFLVDAGFRVVAISDSETALYKKEGLPIDEIERARLPKQKGDRPLRLKEVASLLNIDMISNEALLELPVGVLIPAAHEGVINGENVQKIQSSIILEMANGPVTSEADAILFKKGVPVIPDVLANGGGVMGSYFEMVQNKNGESWSETEVLNKVREQMTLAWQHLEETKKRFDVSYREAAYIRALDRLVSHR